MIQFIIFLVIIILFVFLIRQKIKIKFKTFFQKGFSPEINQYGVYCYCAKQGGGKTFSCISYLYEHRDKELYANLKSINSNVIPYTYISNLDDLLKLRSKKNIIIFFDEIFTEISKLVKTDPVRAKAIMDFLSQMRKRGIILLTTCQEWRLLPLYFRLYVRYQVNCKIIKLPFIGGVIIKNFINGDNIKWDDEEQDFVGELFANVVEHARLKISKLYDTYEQIGEFSNYSKNLTQVEPQALHNEEDLLILKQDEMMKKINNVDFFSDGESLAPWGKRQPLQEISQKFPTDSSIDASFWGTYSKEDLEENEEETRRNN